MELLIYLMRGRGGLHWLEIKTQPLGGEEPEKAGVLPSPAVCLERSLPPLRAPLLRAQGAAILPGVGQVPRDQIGGPYVARIATLFQTPEG